MIRKNKKGFTLVELLAVIVILAIILVIAVPKIMNVIKDTTKASLESSAKMVAAQVENQYTVAQTLGKEFGETGSCMKDWAGLNDVDYTSCTYEVTSDGTAKVTIKGNGKFKGLSACNATRSSATATEGSCSGCSEEEATVLNVNVIKPYEIENSDSCVEFFLEAASKNLLSQSYVNNTIVPMCNGETNNADTFLNAFIKMPLFTEKELIDNKVIKVNIEQETVCVPNYAKDAVTYINNLYNDSNIRGKFGLAKDNTEDENIRYVGQNVQNYVEFGNTGELWRIIGTFEVEKANGGTEELVKIVRDELFKDSEGNELKMSWDSNEETINGGYGINEWSQADLKNMLNTYYIGEGSTCTYCNAAGQVTCANSCNSSVTSINSAYRNMIENVVWNTGAIEWNDDGITPLQAYNGERGNTTGKICTQGDTYCNDTVIREITWEGKIGLIYPSDVGYAGGSACADIKSADCGVNSWTNNVKTNWTMSPVAVSDNAYLVWLVDLKASKVNANVIYGVRPVLYLKSNVKIIDGDGSESNPYKLGV